MTKHRSHSAAFKRQVAQEFFAGETLHGLSQRHDISGQLVRVWVAKYEAGALDDDVQAADLLREYEATIAALPAHGWSAGSGDRVSKGGSEKRTAAEKRDNISRYRPRGLSSRKDVG